MQSSWQLSSTKRRTKVYRLTPKGRQQLKTESGVWTDFVDAVAKVLKAEARPA